VNVDYNKWNPGTGFDPRMYQVAWTGTIRNVQEDVDPTCDIVYHTQRCITPVCPPTGGGSYTTLIPSDSILLSDRTPLRSDALSSSLGWRCRRNKAWEYYEVVSLIDSAALRTQLKFDMQTIYANTSLDSNLRSAALYMKALSHIAAQEYDSAATALATITTSFTATSDSVPAKWELMYLQVLTDTLDIRDSLMSLYTNRVIDDLRRKSGAGSTGLSKMNGQRGESNTQLDLNIRSGSPARPNPSSNGSIALDFESTSTVHCFVDVVDVQGIVLSSFEQMLRTGHNDISVQTSALTPGTYVASVRCNAFVNSVPFVVTR